MDKINNMAKIAVKITHKNEKLQTMLNDKIIRVLEKDIILPNPQDFFEKLHLMIIPFKM